MGGWIKATTIESGRIAAQQYIRGEGRLYIRVFPHKSVTSRPLETRMGKGKGSPEMWVAVVKPGRVMFEIEGVTRELAETAMGLAAAKLGVKTKFVAREEAVTE